MALMTILIIAAMIVARMLKIVFKSEQSTLELYGAALGASFVAFGLTEFIAKFFLRSDAELIPQIVAIGLGLLIFIQCYVFLVATVIFRSTRKRMQQQEMAKSSSEKP